MSSRLRRNGVSLAFGHEGGISAGGGGEEQYEMKPDEVRLGSFQRLIEGQFHQERLRSAYFNASWLQPQLQHCRRMRFLRFG